MITFCFFQAPDLLIWKSIKIFLIRLAKLHSFLAINQNYHFSFQKTILRKSGKTSTFGKLPETCPYDVPLN